MERANESDISAGLRAWVTNAGAELQRYASETKCVRPEDHLSKVVPFVFQELRKLREEVARQKEWLLHAHHERNVLQLRLDDLKKEARQHAEALMEATE